MSTGATEDARAVQAAQGHPLQNMIVSLESPRATENAQATRAGQAAQGHSPQNMIISLDRVFGFQTPEHDEDDRFVIKFENLHELIEPVHLQRKVSKVKFPEPEGKIPVIGTFCQSLRDSLKPGCWRGAAIVFMSNESHARAVAAKYNGASFFGQIVRVDIHKQSQAQTTYRNRKVLQLLISPLKTLGQCHEMPTNSDHKAEPIFECFSRLPAELRLVVWKWHIMSNITTAKRIKHVEWLGCRVGFSSRTPVPACLQINRESRFEAQKQYKVTINSKRASQPVLRYHPGEILYLTGSRTGGISRLTMCRLFDQVNQTGLDRITAIAFDVGLWYAGNLNEAPRMSQLRLQLPALESIRVILSRGLALNVNGSAGVIERPFAFKTAQRFALDRNIVRRNLWSLYQRFVRQLNEEARLHPNWKKPSHKSWNVTRGREHEADWGGP